MPKTDIHVKLSGENGNIFNLVSKASHALRAGGYPDLAKELQSGIWKCGSYDASLALIAEYVVVS
jgi:hypothetical protein